MAVGVPCCKTFTLVIGTCVVVAGADEMAAIVWNQSYQVAGIPKPEGTPVANGPNFNVPIQTGSWDPYSNADPNAYYMSTAPGGCGYTLTFDSGTPNNINAINWNDPTFPQYESGASIHVNPGSALTLWFFNNTGSTATTFTVTITIVND